MRLIRSIAVLVSICLFAAPALLGQGFQIGSIGGVITDQTGGVLPGVTVTVISQERNVSRNEVTDAQGRYRVPSLPLGSYTVEAELEGFQKAVKKNVAVEAAKTTTVDLSLKLAGTTESITVTAQAPVVDATNSSTTTRVSTKEYEKAPVARNYQSIAALAPGVAASSNGNPFANGALSSSNQFLFDGVDTTDPTTGTFSANLNFEAIQEVDVLTTGVSAEYGRATGAVINVITKSGTNTLSGSLKVLGTNDQWNSQNKTENTLTGLSFARTKVDHNNLRYTGTLGGSVVQDRAWFFGAIEKYNPYSAASTTTVTNEEYASKENDKFLDFRADGQITPAHHVWAKYSNDPIKGIIRGYVAGTDLNVLSDQTQGGNTRVAQYNGIFGTAFTLDAMYGSAQSKIELGPHRIGAYDSGAAIYNLSCGAGVVQCAVGYFNGTYFGQGNYTSRPRTQYVAAGTYFLNIGSDTHEIKAGVDAESIKSTSYYTYGNNRLYQVTNYSAANGSFTPYLRLDFVDPGPQTSKGTVDAFYVRDRFSVGRRLNIEAGLRYEAQTGHNDVGQRVFDASTFAPRLSASYDISGNGQMLINATAGRYYDFMLQSLSDGQAQNASRASYDLYNWDAKANNYVFVRHVATAGAGASISPALGLRPGHMDELTLGVQRQFGRTAGLTVRGVYRKWGDLPEDVVSLDANGKLTTKYINYSGAKRTYRALQASFDKRFVTNWSVLANYTYSRTTGNSFSTFASPLLNFSNNMCAVADPSVGTIPCSQGIATASGRAAYDVPHVFNILGTYAHKLGFLRMTYGVGGGVYSGLPYSKSTTMAVLDANGKSIGQTYAYYYEGLGSDRLPTIWQLDGSAEAAFPVVHGSEFALKLEMFNLTDNQEAVSVNRTTWCNADTPACATTRSQYGAQTSRGSFQSPRSFRITALVRF